MEPLGTFNDNRFIFEEVEHISDGLGPTYNAQSCRECHQNVVTGGASQIAEHRTGHMKNGEFFESLGGSLIHSRATHPDIVERVSSRTTSGRSASRPTRWATASWSAYRTARCWRFEPGSLRPCAAPPSQVPVLEADGKRRGSAASAGRISTPASNRSRPMPTSTKWASPARCSRKRTRPAVTYVGFGHSYDPVPDPEDDGVDVDAFADFMRSTKAPSRGPITPTVEAGEEHLQPRSGA